MSKLSLLKIRKAYDKVSQVLQLVVGGLLFLQSTKIVSVKKLFSKKNMCSFSHLLKNFVDVIIR